MKRASKHTTITHIIISIMSISPANAEILVFDGTDPELLRTTPSGSLNSLFPDPVTGNTVSVINGRVDGSTFGAYVIGNGDASNNTVNITGGSVGGTVYGGFSSGIGNATSNSVNIYGGSVGSDVYGGFGDVHGNAADNAVNIYGGSVGRVVYGAYTRTGNIANNVVNIYGGSVGSDVYGAYSDNAGIGNATNNAVNIYGGSVGRIVYGAYIYKGNAANNAVNILGGMVGSDVYGGYTGPDAGDAANNVVNISGGSIAGVVYGGYSRTGNAANNAVHISGGSVGSNIYGGFSTHGNATNNTVSITGGHVAANVYGGHVTVNGNAVNNTVTLGSGATFATTSGIYGGIKGPGSTGDIFTGNTLNLGYRGTLGSIQNFENYNFFVPASLQNGQTQVSTATAVDLNNTHAKVYILGGGSAFKEGDTLTLLDNTSGTPLSFANTAQKGVSLFYDVSLAQANPSLQMRFSAPQVNPQTKSLSEGRASAAAFLNMAGDLAADQGIRSATSATQAGTGLAVFSAFSADSSRFNTGSHINVKGTSLLVGMGSRTGPLMLAGFVEAGDGDYDAVNRFTHAATVTASGNTEYYGLGVLGRYDFSEDGLSGAYVDGTLRVGRSNLGYSSNNLCDVTGQCAAYDTHSAYVGGHLGAGYVLPVSEQTTLDFSSRYFLNRLAGSSVQVVGDPVSFDTATSSRWRNGLRLNYRMQNGLLPYVGMAYDYEFDGKMQGTTYGFGMPAPSLSGGTTMAEAGIGFLRKGMHVDLAWQRFTGLRAGWAGRAAVKYSF